MLPGPIAAPITGCINQNAPVSTKLSNSASKACLRGRVNANRSGVISLTESRYAAGISGAQPLCSAAASNRASASLRPNFSSGQRCSSRIPSCARNGGSVAGYGYAGVAGCPGPESFSKNVA
jgi:hypothetical protein